MITAIHRIGEDACGGIAFWYDDVGARQDMMEAKRVTMPNNVEKPSEGSIMMCGSCGASISPAALDLLPGEYEEIAWAAKLSLKTRILTKARSLLRGFVSYLSHLRTRINGVNAQKR